MRLIDADRVIKRMRTWHEAVEKAYGCNDSYVQGYGAALDVVENAPTVEKQEGKRGWWAHIGGDEWSCSCCGFIKHTEGSRENPDAKYCENCGAKMELGGYKKDELEI